MSLGPGGRISTDIVEEETKRPLASWSAPGRVAFPAGLQEFLDERQLEELDLFDRAQLGLVVDVCRRSRSLARQPAHTNDIAQGFGLGLWILDFRMTFPR